jgi:hypothetical protein
MSEQKQTKKRKSKYQRKLARRRAEAKRLDLPVTATWPEIWVAQSQQKGE